ncbi:cell division topological specificity factor MinE [Solirhodobacter olei]|uniref:cell division topological specificity factor MinE n=1 Tax=Solirhodobacter olei TaxID=2493082 RepID=UPI000FD90A31|nr:cell division topological specificity factor MinE [Solirhodobacter olei]
MRLGSLWPRKASTAQTAKERLQILLAHERAGRVADNLPALQRDIIEVIGRHLKIDSEAIDIRMEQGRDYSSLEINIEFPAASEPKAPSRR